MGWVFIVSLAYVAIGFIVAWAFSVYVVRQELKAWKWTSKPTRAEVSRKISSQFRQGDWTGFVAMFWPVFIVVWAVYFTVKWISAVVRAVFNWITFTFIIRGVE